MPGLSDFQSSSKARPIAKLLAQPETVLRMEALSRAGRPAVLAVDQELPSDIALDDTEKKHVGRWVRNVLADRGWRPRQRKSFRSGRIFSSGAVYERAAVGTEASATPVDAEIVAKLKRAQEIVRRSSKGLYGVDEFIRDKRREAARETRAHETATKPPRV